MGIFSNRIWNKLENELWNTHFNHITDNIPESAVNLLSAPVTDMEVKAAVFQLAPTKAPGPDGFSAIFYQKCWPIIKTEFCSKICNMMNANSFDDGINDTTVVLIPKTKNPTHLKQFRPILLCNVSGKVITKILANWLKSLLPSLISESQSAFLQDRGISDNFLLAHELAHFINSRKNQQVGFMSLKTNMNKAYDRIEWRFLEGMLKVFGFPVRWVELVLKCVSSVRYKIRINGHLSDYVIPQRGLRQGDPL